MPTPHERHIYQQLAALLGGQLDFEHFSNWLLAQQQEIPASDPARRLLFRIIARLDEYDSSAMTDRQLRAYLLAILPDTLRASLPDTPAPIKTPAPRPA